MTDPRYGLSKDAAAGVEAGAPTAADPVARASQVSGGIPDAEITRFKDDPDVGPGAHVLPYFGAAPFSGTEITWDTRQNSLGWLDQHEYSSPAGVTESYTSVGGYFTALTSVLSNAHCRYLHEAPRTTHAPGGMGTFLMFAHIRQDLSQADMCVLLGLGAQDTAEPIDTQHLGIMKEADGVATNSWYISGRGTSGRQVSSSYVSSLGGKFLWFYSDGLGNCKLWVDKHMTDTPDISESFGTGYCPSSTLVYPGVFMYNRQNAPATEMALYAMKFWFPREY